MRRHVFSFIYLGNVMFGGAARGGAEAVCRQGAKHEHGR